MTKIKALLFFTVLLSVQASAGEVKYGCYSQMIGNGGRWLADLDEGISVQVNASQWTVKPNFLKANAQLLLADRQDELKGLISLVLFDENMKQIAETKVYQPLPKRFEIHLNYPQSKDVLIVSCGQEN
jgi:hypothetical protein